MSRPITELLFPVRHPERSEATESLSSMRPRPSAVEGPSRCGLMASSGAAIPGARLRGSFDFGSIERSGEKHLPLAFAQDDGIFLATPEGGSTREGNT